jgi:AraC-like DNA-binding protein
MPPRRPSQIRDLPFRHGAKPELGLEVFRLSDLYARAERGKLDHALETPQRPEFHTIYCGLRGKGALVVDFTAVPLGAGYVTIVARGRVQQFVPDRGVDAWMILVEPELVEPSSLLSPAWPEPAIALRGDERIDIPALAEQLAAEHARPSDRVQRRVLVALLDVVLLRCERLQPGWAATSRALEHFFTILDRDCTRTRSVAHYAKAAALSPRRLGELLVERTGKSTKQIVDERVVLEHKRLLAHTDLSVKQLAERTGFAEPTNLVKFFRLHTGQTPLEFRSTFLPSSRRSSPRVRRRRR